MNPPDETLSYAAAVIQLESILTELEDNTIDVDVLAARVKEAAGLLRFCRQRLEMARVDIDHVMAELDDVDRDAAEKDAAP